MNPGSAGGSVMTFDCIIIGGAISVLERSKMLNALLHIITASAALKWNVICECITGIYMHLLELRVYYKDQMNVDERALKLRCVK